MSENTNIKHRIKFQAEGKTKKETWTETEQLFYGERKDSHLEIVQRRGFIERPATSNLYTSIEAFLTRHWDQSKPGF